MKLVIDYQGTTYDVPPSGLADLVAFERHFGIPASAIGQSPRLEYLAYLCWRSLRRNGVTDLPFGDEFLDGIEDLDVREVEAAVDPTSDPAPLIA